MKKLFFTLLLVIAAVTDAGASTPDSIRNNMADLDSLILMVETNYAGFPIIMQKGYGEDYQTMKRSITEQVAEGKMGIEQAVCEYCYWFFSQFDGHVYVDHDLFFKDYFSKCHIRYAELFEYDPKPVSCKVNDDTWMIRVPSCMGENPTIEWVKEAAQQYLASGCKNLIIDIRGNTGGGDAIWDPIVPLLFDHYPVVKEYTLFRKTPKNLGFYQRILKEHPDDEIAIAVIDSCSKSQDEMVRMDDEEEDADYAPSPLPKKAAIVIDKSTASSAETLVRFAKMYCDSTRTQVYGKENTWGAQYSGNIIGTPLPNSKIWVYYPTCISSLFLNGGSNGSAGLSPDVRIDLPYPKRLTDNCDEWIIWVADQL